MAAAISQDDYLNDTSTFDLARKKAADQAAVNIQARKDALARRYAQLGNFSSGSRIKQEENAVNAENSNLQNANESINAAQNQELARRKEVVQGQQFQSGEAQKGRDFAALQSDLQRKYQTAERLSGQDFASGEAQKGRQFATSERLSGQDFASSEAAKQQKIQQEQFEKTYGLSMAQFQAAQQQFKDTFGEEVRINNANLDFAQQALDKKGFLENLTGEGSATGKLGNAWTNIYKGASGFVNQVGSWF